MNSSLMVQTALLLQVTRKRGELDGRSGVWLTLTDEAGNIVDRTFIFNGLDGESPTISTK